MNRIVNSYLEFAELQAMSRKVMAMKDWIAKLDDFLKLGERDILTHAGSVSHEDAVAKAQAEYEKFHAQELLEPSPVEGDFMEVVGKVQELETKTAKIKSSVGFKDKLRPTQGKKLNRKNAGRAKGSPKRRKN